MHVATPDGEAHIIADDRQYPPAMEGEYLTLRSCRDELPLATRGEEVSLRLSLHLPLFVDEEEHIIDLAIACPCEVAPCDSYLVLLG